MRLFRLRLLTTAILLLAVSTLFAQWRLVYTLPNQSLKLFSAASIGSHVFASTSPSVGPSGPFIWPPPLIPARHGTQFHFTIGIDSTGFRFLPLVMPTQSFSAPPRGHSAHLTYSVR